MPQSSPGGSGKTGSAVLAKLIRDRRHQLGLSRQDLAESTGVPYSTVAQIETAYRGVSPSRLGVIARALQLDPAELYDVLASEPAVTASRQEAPGRVAAADAGDDSWHGNPTYLAAPDQPAAAVPPGAAPPPPASPDTDTVNQVLELLSQLPAERRLKALSDVQSELLSGLVQDEVQRITRAGH